MENVNFIKHALADDSDMLAAMMGMHASFTISDETMELCNELKPEGVGYHIHVAEGIYDLHQCLKEHGKRIVDRLYDWNILGPKTLLGHCIYINEHEMDLIKDTDTMVVHNPESNMGNACGCPPTMALVHKGIVTGLEQTATPRHDGILESGQYSHKHHLCDPNAAWGEVPQMLFEGNRTIANRYFKKKLGVLEPGAAADVIVIDYDPLTPMRADNTNGHLLFGVNGSMVQTTVCNGEVLMKDRELLVSDEAKIMADCRQRQKSLRTTSIPENKEDIMSEKMTCMPFGQLMDWVLTEHGTRGTVFGVHRSYKADPARNMEIFGRNLETPIGPAAGPNTQLAQNIAASYFAGARFFELKTVQKMDGDELAACINRPCILAEDECYNCEWSTELYVPQAMGEYIKAWFMLHVMAKEFGLGSADGFQFNISVGYDLAGIKEEKIDTFIESMKEAKDTEVFRECRQWLLDHLDRFKNVTREDY